MIYFYAAKMQKGTTKIKGFAHTLTSIQEWIEQQQSKGFSIVGTIQTGLFERNF